MKALELICSTGLAKSQNEAKRYLYEGSVRLNGIRLLVTEDNRNPEIPVKAGDVLTIGKKEVMLTTGVADAESR